MPQPFASGETVRLKPGFATAIQSGRCKVDWTTRKGTVIRCNQNEVYICWEGRTTPDHLPIRGVEKA